jgi:hypothetical protein
MCGCRLPPSSLAKQTCAAQCQQDAAGLEAADQPTNHAVDVRIISSKDQIADIMTQRP